MCCFRGGGGGGWFSPTTQKVLDSHVRDGRVRHRLLRAGSVEGVRVQFHQNHHSVHGLPVRVHPVPVRDHLRAEPSVQPRDPRSVSRSRSFVTRRPLHCERGRNGFQYFSRFKNASGRPGSYEEALFNLMTILTTTRMPLYKDFQRLKKWKAHFNELNTLNVSDMLLKVTARYSNATLINGAWDLMQTHICSESW